MFRNKNDKSMVVRMPNEYKSQPILEKMRELRDDVGIQDFEILFKLSGSAIKANSFFLSLSSPVLHKMISGCFKESVNRKVELEDIDEKSFEIIINLWIGKEDYESQNSEELIRLAMIADRLQITAVEAALEAVVLQTLNVAGCLNVLIESAARGLTRLEHAARTMALRRFVEVAASDSFIQLDEETLGSLLEDDNLVSENEEAILDCLLRWMKSGPEGWRGRNLLKKIRFPLMSINSLAVKTDEALPPEHVDWIHSLVCEALKVQSAPACTTNCLRHLGPKACVHRRGTGVKLSRYAEGGERRIHAHEQSVWCLAYCQGRVCSGSNDGTIRVWDRERMQSVLTLRMDDRGDVWSLNEVQGMLVSGHSDGRLRVWDLASGHQLQMLEGHEGSVFALAVCGAWLVSGSEDHTLRVWSTPARVPWRTERTLSGHNSGVECLATCRDKVLSGSLDKTIRVWAPSTGALVAKLTGHSGSVRALAVCHDRLYSASFDRTIRVWSVDTWAQLRSVEVGGVPAQFPYRLAVCGEQLVSGSAYFNADAASSYEVRSWSLDSLECDACLRQPAGMRVFALLPLAGEIWGAVGSSLAVWGRELGC